jgi:hypothetical protein
MGERGRYFERPADAEQVKLAEAMARVRALRRLANLETRLSANTPSARLLGYTHTAWTTTKGRVVLSEREP